MGASYSSAVWYPAVQALAASHRVITFDNRGTGGSSWTPVASIEDMASDALAVLDAAGVQTAHVYGASLGGVVPGGPATVRPPLPGNDRGVEVWLPHGAVTELRAVRVDAGTELRPAPRTGPRWVHHGSSISHCLEASSPRRPGPPWSRAGRGSTCSTSRSRAGASWTAGPRGRSATAAPT